MKKWKTIFHFRYFLSAIVGKLETCFAAKGSRKQARAIFAQEKRKANPIAGLAGIKPCRMAVSKK
jgi:hypothetical protein